MLRLRGLVHRKVCLVIAAGALCIAFPTAATAQAGTPEAELSRSFQCPESLASDSARQDSVKAFVTAYAHVYPDANVRDAMIFRYRLLKEHSCLQTLKKMLTTVGPLTQMLSFEGSDYGPRTEDYSRETRVLSVFFRKEAATPELSEQDIIFNFYGWQPAATPPMVAQAFLRDREGTTILGKFQAPDELTGKPAYFIVSQTAYPERKCAYVNISKVAAADTSTYAVTFAKKFTAGTISEALERGKQWFLSVEGQSSSRELGRMSVDSGWQSYMEQARGQGAVTRSSGVR